MSTQTDVEMAKETVTENQQSQQYQQLHESHETKMMTTEKPELNEDQIKFCDYVLFKMPSGSLKMHEIKPKGKINLGKFGGFYSSEIVGKYYDITHEIFDRDKVRIAETESILETIEIESNEKANNQYLVDDMSSQKLSLDEIEALKNEKSGQDMVKSLLENSKTFDTKTDFAKAKYIKRKEKKYSKTFVPMKVNAESLCFYFSTVSHTRIMNFRIDTLSQMMTFANVHAGAKLIVLDNAGGLVLGTALERMGGLGKILQIHNRENPGNAAIQFMNIKKSFLKIVRRLSCTQLNDLDSIPDEMEVDVINYKLQFTIEAKKFWLQGGFDGLLIAAEEEAVNLLEKIVPQMAGGRPIVIYSPYKELLLEAYMYMRNSRSFVNVQLTESWMREYQIPLQLSGTHPMMTTSGSGGFLLSAITVIPSDENIITHQVFAKRRSKKAKNE